MKKNKPVRGASPKIAALLVAGMLVPAALLAAPASLYERLGGEKGITAVAEEFLSRALADPRLNFTRKGTPAEWQDTPENRDAFKRKFVEFVGSVTGGPQEYTGKDMKSAHRGMKISNPEFDAAIDDLIGALEKLEVPEKEKAELLFLVGKTRLDVVEES